MAKVLLMVPHFWDPVCVPLGITSLKAFAEAAGHEVELFDFNMRELKIPNPYSVYEWVSAEGRWNSLGRSAHWNVETSMMALNA